MHVRIYHNEVPHISFWVGLLQIIPSLGKLSITF
jgi:hypothetical protein